MASKRRRTLGPPQTAVSEKAKPDQAVLLTSLPRNTLLRILSFVGVVSCCRSVRRSCGLLKGLVAQVPWAFLQHYFRWDAFPYVLSLYENASRSMTRLDWVHYFTVLYTKDLQAEMDRAGRLFPNLVHLTVRSPTYVRGCGNFEKTRLNGAFLAAFTHLESLRIGVEHMDADWQTSLDGVASSLRSFDCSSQPLALHDASRRPWWSNLEHLTCLVALDSSASTSTLEFPAHLESLTLNYEGGAWHRVVALLERLPCTVTRIIVRRSNRRGVSQHARPAGHVLDALVAALERLPNLVKFDWSSDEYLDPAHDFQVEHLVCMARTCPKLAYFRLALVDCTSPQWFTHKCKVVGDINAVLRDTMDAWRDIKTLDVLPCSDEWSVTMTRTELPSRLTSAPVVSRGTMQSSIDIDLLSRWLKRHARVRMGDLLCHFPIMLPILSTSKATQDLSSVAAMNSLLAIKARVSPLVLATAAGTAGVALQNIFSAILLASGAAQGHDLSIVPVLACKGAPLQLDVSAVRSRLTGPSADNKAQEAAVRPDNKSFSHVSCSQPLRFAKTADLVALLELFKGRMSFNVWHLHSVHLDEPLSEAFWDFWFSGCASHPFNSCMLAVRLARRLTEDEMSVLTKWLQGRLSLRSCLCSTLRRNDRSSDPDTRCRWSRYASSSQRILTFDAPETALGRDFSHAILEHGLAWRLTRNNDNDGNPTCHMGWVDCR